MNDDQRDFCRRLAKAVTSGGTYTYQGEQTATSLFQGGNQPSPWAQRAAARLGTLKASRYAGSDRSQSNLVGQAVRAVNRGKLSVHDAVNRLKVSTARRAVATTTPAPGAALRGSGGSGYTGAPATALGQAQTAGTYVKPPGT
jgi:hypothetical protein